MTGCYPLSSRSMASRLLLALLRLCFYLKKKNKTFYLIWYLSVVHNCLITSAACLLCVFQLLSLSI